MKLAEIYTETVELIFEHAMNQGLYDEDYVASVLAMDELEQEAELDRLETIAVYGGY